MKILLTGSTGQVGHELRRSLQGLGDIVAPDRSQLDLSNLDHLRQVIREVKPQLIVNPAAYTAVDKAESEPKLALRVNGEAPGVIAEEAKKLGAALIHYSTDYVFDGAKATPYTEEDTPSPINVYGRTKLAGEQAIEATGGAYLILRTGWVYGMRGHNFLLTMLRLARERDELRVVDDQHGNPTWCRTIADLTAHIVAQGSAVPDQTEWWRESTGRYHLTARGNTTWHGFAQAIMRDTALERKPIVTAITTDQYPLPAARPRNSILSCDRLRRFSCEVPHWQDALKLSLQ